MVETTTVPLTELQECLASEGAKDHRIEALEAALDWALVAVFEHYTEGEAPPTPGAYEEIEKARARIIAECNRLAAETAPREASLQESASRRAKESNRCDFDDSLGAPHGE